MPQRSGITVKEAIELETCSDSGSRIIQMTSSDAVFDNIYSEVAYMDASSRWFMVNKITDRDSHPGQGSSEVWRGDLNDYSLTRVADRIVGIVGMAVSPDQRYFCCIRDTGGGASEILRIDFASLEQTANGYDRSVGTPVTLGSMAPDNRTFVVGVRLTRHNWGIVRYDLEVGEHHVLHERGCEMCNPHPQIEPGRGEDIMVQHNRGAEVDERGNVLKSVGEQGATFYLIDLEGSDLRELPAGKPYTWPCQGHQAWVGATGEILFTTGWSTEEAGKREGVLRVLRPGDEQSRVVATGHLFNHPSPSKDGRFFVSETYGRARLIVVGSIKTGKTRVLCDAQASAKDHYSCPEPYFSPDCRWVIFSSDRTGTPHVYAATVPDGLLEELEQA